MRRTFLATGLVAATVFAGSFLGTAQAGQRFTDVGPNHPFKQPIEWAATNGIAGGYPDGSFRGSEPVTRQAMAAFLGRTIDGVRLVRIAVDPPPGTSFTTWALCGLRGRALAGGARIDVPDTYLADSSARDGHQWQVRFETEDGVQRDPAQLEMWMLCVPDLSTAPLDP
jgi:hypothetical protein